MRRKAVKNCPAPLQVGDLLEWHPIASWDFLIRRLVLQVSSFERASGSTADWQTKSKIRFLEFEAKHAPMLGVGQLYVWETTVLYRDGFALKPFEHPRVR